MLFILDYCRPIICSDDEKLILHNEDIIFLTEKTISENLLFILNNYCFKCTHFIPKNIPVHILKCECRLCIKCIRNLLFDATDGKNIINAYEKSKITKLISDRFKRTRGILHMQQSVRLRRCSFEDLL